MRRSTASARSSRATCGIPCESDSTCSSWIRSRRRATRSWVRSRAPDCHSPRRKRAPPGSSTRSPREMAGGHFYGRYQWSYNPGNSLNGIDTIDADPHSSRLPISDVKFGLETDDWEILCLRRQPLQRAGHPLRPECAPPGTITIKPRGTGVSASSRAGGRNRPTAFNDPAAGKINASFRAPARPWVRRRFSRRHR